ncbi:DUF3237 domain-containing protein [Nitratireductor sp. XY-223]|uniref:DUF3237 domain-containing protein n=1 Tax=Nitratireductor sp. XY-223 TaxID=2561926 RepID=UPI00145BAD6C|nr:DUF3237 domain-containing protein [Nitratireductor sp. XY-223]
MKKEPQLNYRYLGSAQAELESPPVLIGSRIIVNVLGGTFEGPEMSGKILHSGGDWLSVRPDGSMAIDVRSTLETDDGALIFTWYSGRIVLPPEMHEMDAAERHTVDPSKYYFRAAPYYQTVSEKYAWLNNIQAVAVGRMTENGVAYDIFEIL